MPALINLKLIENPANWAIVGLITLIGAFAVHSVLPVLTGNPNNS